MPNDHVWGKKMTQATPSPTPGVRPRRHNENLILLFLSTNIKFSIKIFEIDFSNMIVDLCTRPWAPGGRPQKSAVAQPTHMKISHTKLGWISSNG